MGCGAATLTEVDGFNSPVTIKDTQTTLPEFELKHVQPDPLAQSSPRSPLSYAQQQVERPVGIPLSADVRSETSSVSLEVIGESQKVTPRSIISLEASENPYIPSCISDMQSISETPKCKRDMEAIMERLIILALSLAGNRPCIASGFVIAAAGIVARMPDVLGSSPQPAVAVALASAALSAAEAGSAAAPGLIKTAASSAAATAESRSQRRRVDYPSMKAAHEGDLLLVQGLAESAAEMAHMEGRYAADLARAAAGFAKYAIPENLEPEPEPHPDLAVGLAKVASAAVEVGSPTAISLIQAAAASAVNAVRSHCEIADGKIRRR